MMRHGVDWKRYNQEDLQTVRIHALSVGLVADNLPEMETFPEIGSLEAQDLVDTYVHMVYRPTSSRYDLDRIRC